MATAAEDGASLRIDKFMGENFHLWKFKMQMVLEERDLWGIVSGEEVEPTGDGTTQATVQKFRKRARKAFATICLSLGDEQLSLVRSSKTAKDAWDKLESHYQVKSLANKLFLRKKYFTATMAESDAMLEHINRMKSLAGQLESVGATVTEEDQVATLLCSLPDSYNNLIIALESRAEDLRMDFLVARLLHEEHKRKGEIAASDATEKAMVSFKGKPGKQAENKSYIGKTSMKKKGKCYNCGVQGHFAKDCRKPKTNNEFRRQREQANTSACTEGDDEKGHVLFLMSSDAGSASQWYIDSGASQHMTNSKASMVHYQEFSSPELVRMGNNYEVKAYGKGNIWIEVKAEGVYKPAELVDVLYVPALGKNLFSVSAVTKRGNTVLFEKGKCTILNSSGVEVGSGKLQGKLFSLNANIQHTHEAKIANQQTEEIWHKRYGHLSQNNLRSLQNNNLVKGMSFKIDEGIKGPCDACLKGKQSRNSFPKEEATRATELLEIIHSDVCGPMKSKSLGGNAYFVTFIDDKSRFTTVYFMRNKSEVFNKFKEFEAMATNVTGKRIRILRCDNGGEYTSKVFDEYLKSKGIQRQFSVPRTPQQNGVSERMNRTIQEVARAMVHGAGLSDIYWAEAVLTAVIIRNRSPTTAVQHMTPHECFYGKKPDVSNFKIFGCTAYMHISNQERRKWDAKSVKCIFIGYSINSKGYRLWDPKARRIHVSRDVVFFEEDFDGRTNESQCVKGSSKSDITLPSTIISNDINDQEAVFNHDDVAINNDENDEEEREIPRRSTRNRKVPERNDFITGNWWEIDEALYSCADDVMGEPKTVKEALESPDKSKWKKALDCEYESLVEYNTWDLVEPPKGQNIVDSKWVFKVKYNADGSIERYKTRLVAKGFTQKAGIDFEETFSPVVRYTSIRALLAIVNQLDLELHQMDVSTAFLNGELKEDIYMSQPEGYIQEGKEDMVCKLNKSIYGLKQASRCWYDTLGKFLKDAKYRQCAADSCIYMKQVGVHYTYIAVYVDDILIASNSKVMLHNEKKLLQERFNTKDLGEAHYCLGIQIQRNREQKQMFLHQTKYLTNLLEKYGMSDCRSISTPQEQNKIMIPNEDEPVDKVRYQAVIGSITYAVIATRPDLAQALGSVNRFASNPSKEHWTAVKRILRYIKGTVNHGILFGGQKENDVHLEGYVDADWGSNPNGRKSQSGYVFFVCGGIISWASKKQPIIALSSTEAEYIAANLAVQEAIWLRSLLNDFGFVQKQPTNINEDNQGVIALCKNPKFHSRTKHIDIKYHFIREKIKDSEITLKYCSTQEMIADALTKPLGKIKFQRFKDLMGVSSFI